MSPFKNLKEILGEDLFFKINHAKILVVGAGGIGCELVKNLVLCGFFNITIIDMDGIDISNLNRQFFFRRKHVGMYKSTVVASEAKKLFDRYHSDGGDSVNIVGIVGNIMDYSTEFFDKFDFVLNALDNISARSYVNKVCLASNIELIDSGSTGYNGQVHPIIPRISRCYECYPPPTPKSFPVCTIRSVPDKPQHTVAWSKYLFEIIFGARHNENEDSDNILSDLSKKVQIDLNHLKQLENGEKDEFIKNYILSMFDFLFNSEITSLAKNEDVYISKHKKIPVPISWDGALRGIYENKDFNSGENVENSEQNVPSIKESAELFYKSVYRIITSRLNEIGTSTICFDKDDKDFMDFISAASNLRSYNFHIPLQSRWACQSIAGSIIPAVASTNAIVSGIQVVQLLLMLKSRLKCGVESSDIHGSARNNMISANRFVWIRSIPVGRFIICPEELEKCNTKCLICSQVLVKIKICSLDRWFLKEFVEGVISKNLKLSEPSIELNGRCIWDPDLLQEEQFLNSSSQKSLSFWKFTDGSIISITDFSCGKFQCDAVISVCDENRLKSEKELQTHEKNGELYTISIESTNSCLGNNHSYSDLSESSDDEVLSEQESPEQDAKHKRRNPNMAEDKEFISNKRR
ncbi:putative SUMO-1 activating enzyme subunit 2 [Cryptosporidium canis]|uniref:SUMO-activating enzyme subunit n=1 Tax=Cryptosporidium canis TaxID=195482 RepID=A0ABQ8P7C2_9CRYT|nr:putative SUMO-1 activating enzyme subunit 2 [Cryptosporidium canis]KAJ1614073.1 putative SUMO-1 activating enzyme subunit 2 [Cryptosporidium canis]